MEAAAAGQGHSRTGGEGVVLGGLVSVLMGGKKEERCISGP